MKPFRKEIELFQSLAFPSLSSEAHKFLLVLNLWNLLLRWHTRVHWFANRLYNHFIAHSQTGHKIIVSGPWLAEVFFLHETRCFGSPRGRHYKWQNCKKKISEPAQSAMIYNSYWTLILFSQGYVPLHKGLLPLVVNDPFTIGEGI